MAVDKSKGHGALHWAGLLCDSFDVHRNSCGVHFAYSVFMLR